MYSNYCNLCNWSILSHICLELLLAALANLLPAANVVTLAQL